MNFQKMKTLWDVPDSMGGSIAGGAVEDTSSGLITLAIMVSGVFVFEALGTRSERKTGLCGKNSQAADPPHPPPQFGKPLLSKKSWVYFSF